MLLSTLASGSSGNAAVLSGGRTNILIDAGISNRRIIYGLKNLDIGKEDLGAIVITHEHSDHIRGLRVLIKNTSSPIYAPSGTARHIIRNVDGSEGRIIQFSPGDSFDVGDISVISFPTPHDSISSCGYSFFHRREKVTCVTDFGHITDDIAEAVTGSDILMLEANHDEDMLRYGPYPYFLKKRILSDQGHLSNSECGRLAVLAASSGTRRLILAHLSRENNTPGNAEEEVRKALSEAGAHDDSLTITVASPDLQGSVHNTDK